MQASAFEPVYAVCGEVITVLGSKNSFWQALCEGKSGLRPACEAFPDWFADKQNAVGALSIEESESRLEVISDRLLAMLEDRIFDRIYAATSLGDLIGKWAGYPQHVLTSCLQKWEVQGSIRIISSACSSGSDALSLGYLAVCAKQADLVLVLAVDSLCPAKLAHHIALGTQSPTRARPFDLVRDGTSFGEGGAFLILANEKGLSRLKKLPQAEVIGVGFSCDGYDITVPDPSGQWAARAIARCNCVPEYINAHGTGTVLNDLAEARALLSACDLSNCFISSTKGAIGHCLGATGLIEAIVCMQVLHTGKIPGTVGLKEVDPILGFTPLIQGRLIEKQLETALSATFGFGGVNSAVSLRKI